jgi:hypothetical protein
VLQVTLSFVPRLESYIRKIWLLAVTAVVFTVTVVPAAAMFTEPAAAEPQTAGDAEDEQLVPVKYAPALTEGVAKIVPENVKLATDVRSPVVAEP